MSDFKDTVKKIQIVVKTHEEYINYEKYHVYRDELSMHIWFRFDWSLYYSHEFNTDVNFYLKNDLIFDPIKFRKYVLSIIYDSNTCDPTSNRQFMNQYNSKIMYLTPCALEIDLNRNWGITTDDFIEDFRMEILAYIKSIKTSILSSLIEERKRLDNKIKKIKNIKIKTDE